MDRTTWEATMANALEAYRRALEAWKADPTPDNQRMMEVASDHVVYLETLEPKNESGK
jgi:hypothetical protein